jgi:hypothetical protein
MDASAIRTLVEDELEGGAPFINSHGITRANLRSHLVDPYSIRIDPDDLETTPRDVWVVLRQRPSSNDGYVVIYDPLFNRWGVAESDPQPGTTYTLVVSAGTLSEALEAM